MQLPSVDVFIGLFFLIGIAYCFLFQREKTVTTLCSVYMGIVIASSFSQTLFEFFNGNKVVANQIWIKSNASVSTIAIILLLTSIVLVSGVISSKSSKSDDTGALEIIVYSALTIALIISSIIGFLPEDVRNHYLNVSIAAKILFNYHTLFVVAPPVAIVMLGVKSKKK